MWCVGATETSEERLRHPVTEKGWLRLFCSFGDRRGNYRRALSVKEIVVIALIKRGTAEYSMHSPFI